MALPVYLDSDVRMLYVDNVADVNTVITAILDELDALGYTSAGGDKRKSPVDADGRFYYVTPSRISATALRLTAYDQNNVQTGDLAFTLAAPITVWICSGTFHLHVSAVGSGTSAPQWVSAGMLDQSPEAQGSHNKYVYSSGSFFGANPATTRSTSWKMLYMIDNATEVLADRVIDYYPDTATVSHRYTALGNPIFRPKEVMAYPAGLNAFRYCGRCYQLILVPNIFNQLCKIKVPIDGSTLGNFFVTAELAYKGLNVAVRIP